MMSMDPTCIVHSLLNLFYTHKIHVSRGNGFSVLEKLIISVEDKTHTKGAAGK